MEDYPANQLLFRSHLARAGYTVTVAENGRIAVERLQVSPYDLVIMDVQMPEMAGYTATDRIRTGRKRSATIPIIGPTTNALDEDRRRRLIGWVDQHLDSSSPAGTDAAL